MSLFESVGNEGGHRKSLIPVVTFEVLFKISDSVKTHSNYIMKNVWRFAVF